MTISGNELFSIAIPIVYVILGIFWYRAEVSFKKAKLNEKAKK